METLNKRVDYLEEDIREINQKLKDQEVKLNSKIDNNHNEIKVLIKETELHNREKTAKLFDGLERLTDAQHKQTLATNNLVHETRENKKSIDEFKDSDKWKSRTIAGFAISLILMVIGTFWGMFFPM